MELTIAYIGHRTRASTPPGRKAAEDRQAERTTLIIVVVVYAQAVDWCKLIKFDVEYISP